MIGSIRKHSQALWWVIIVAMVIGLVWWGSQGSKTGGGNEGEYGSINGTKISAAMFEEARREVKLFYFFNTGNWPGSGRTAQGFEMERETYNRLFLALKAREMNVAVDDELVNKVASDRLRMLNNGQPVNPTEFENQVLAREKLTLLDYERYIRGELAIQQLIAMFGVTGDLVTAEEVRALYQRDFQEVSAKVALFKGADYLKSVTNSAEKVAEFYTNQMPRYRLPERVKVHYVEFPVSNYLAAAITEFNAITNLDEQLDMALMRMGTNLPAGITNIEQARAKLIENEQRRMAGGNAFKAASEFNKALIESQPVDAARIVTLAKERGYVSKVTEPFSQNEAPAGLAVGEEFVRVAFGLTLQEPFYDPVPGTESIFVLSYNGRLPSEIPALDVIRDRVTSDYQFIESASLARKAALEFENGLSNAMAGGKSFADACAKAGVTLTPLAPFSMASTNIAELSTRANVDQFKRIALATAPGQFTPLMPSADGAFMAVIEAKLPLDESKMAANLPAFTRSVHQVRRSEIFQEWFRREASKAFATVPYFQQKMQQQQQPAPVAQ
jgi:hypothetical protein